MFDLNLMSAIQLVQHCKNELRQNRASLVLVSSGASTSAYETWGSYCMSKSALNMFASVLGAEEKLFTTVSVRPGVVDTRMQSLIRENGKDVMPDSLFQKFTDLKKDGKLLDPSLPGTVIADLALEPRHDLSGKFFSWDSIP